MCPTGRPGRPGSIAGTDGSGIADVVGTVLESDPPQRLVITFDDPDPAVRSEDPPVVTFEVEPFRDIVQLTVTHTRIPSEADLELAALGWSSVLSNLKTLLETGAALPKRRGRCTPLTPASIADVSDPPLSALSDGTAVRVEPFRPQDRAGLREELIRGFEQLSDHSRTSRFLSGTPRLTSAQLRHLVDDVDGIDHVAFVLGWYPTTHPSASGASSAIAMPRRRLTWPSPSWTPGSARVPGRSC